MKVILSLESRLTVLVLRRITVECGRQAILELLVSGTTKFNRPPLFLMAPLSSVWGQLVTSSPDLRMVLATTTLLASFVGLVVLLARLMLVSEEVLILAWLSVLLITEEPFWLPAVMATVFECVDGRGEAWTLGTTTMVIGRALLQSLLVMAGVFGPVEMDKLDA